MRKTCYLPHWRLDPVHLQIIQVANTWNETLAESAGGKPNIAASLPQKDISNFLFFFLSLLTDKPESTPSAGSSTSTSSNAGATSTTAAGSGSKKSSNAGAIAGGVVGGILGAVLLGGLIFWYTRRRRWRSVAKPSPFMTDAPHVAEAFGLPDPETSMPMPKFYVSNYL